MCYLTFNKLLTHIRQTALTYTMCYRFALSFCDFSLFPRQAKSAPAGLHCSLGGMHPPSQNKGVLAVIGETKLQSDEAVTFKRLLLSECRTTMKCGEDSSDVDK